MSIDQIKKDLFAPFHPKDLEHRIGRCGKKGDRVWASIFTYVTNRAIMDRLDEVFGIDGWESNFHVYDDGATCSITGKFGEKWVTKSDGANKSDIEPFKGAISGAQKRAAVQFGIGRYLYNLDESWAFVYEHGMYKAYTKDTGEFYWSPPALPSFALPSPELEHMAMVRSIGTLFKEVDTKKLVTVRRQTATIAELAQVFKPFLQKDYYLTLELYQAMLEAKGTT